MILCARRVDALAKVAEQCTAAHKESGLKQGGKFATVQLDVADKAQVASLFDKIPQDLHDVDILGGYCAYCSSEFKPFSCRSCVVNNAGFVYGTERVGDIAPSDYEAMFATNVFGLIAMTQLLVKSKRCSSSQQPIV